MNICTIIAKNYLAHARVLAASFHAHHPDGRCFVLIIDQTDGYVDAADESFELVRPEDVGLTAFDEMRGAYGVMELSTAVKPWLLRHMLDQHDDGSGVAYMDPDIQILSRMVELEAALREHAVVLTPHVLHGMPRDGKRPSETDILMAGVYNLGFIGMSDRPDSRLVLDWWSERLLTDCHVAPERGLFVDQRWVDFVPGLISDLCILRHPAYNVAYWNLPERDLQRREGTYLADGEPVRFFHFSGYSPDRRTLLSKHQDRVQVTEDDALWTLCDAYGDGLVQAGFDDVRDLPYEHDVLPSGLRLTPLTRALYRTAIEAGTAAESLFTPSAEADFVAWLAAPSDEVPQLNRYLYALWAGRTDLRRAYSEVLDGIVDGYLGWCAVYGSHEVGIPAALIPESHRRAGDNAAASESEPTPSASTPGTAVPPLERPYGVNVAGYLQSELGIGEVARQIIRGLDTVGVATLPVGLVTPNSRQGHGYAAAGNKRNPFPVNLVCVNADGLPAFAREAGAGFFEGRYSIGVWWWETSEFPERFHGAFEHLDEIWVGSRFIAETLQTVSPIPVIHVPIPVHYADVLPLSPGELGWPDAFTFLFSWDYNSVFARKNPLAVIEAYTSAFDDQAGTALVLKCINVLTDSTAHRQVRDAIAGRPDIVLMDDYLDPHEKDRLMASCDCYVSLHRSEGLGLTIAEAMFHGKPVVATNYSGNTDFMSATNSYPVPFELVPIGEGAAPYPSDGEWASPDVAAASCLLRRVLDDREEASARGRRAAADIRRKYAPAAAGDVMRRRLEHIAGRVPQDAPPGPTVTLSTSGLTETRRLVERGSGPDRASRFGKPGAAARRLVLRVMRPYTAYQQQVNASMEQALCALSSMASDVEQAATRARREAEQVDLRLAEAHAGTLANLRLHQAQMEELSATITRLGAEAGARLDAVEQQPAERLAADRLVTEARALPYMASDAFHEFDGGAAGVVFGYEHRLSVVDEHDAYRTFENLFRGSEEFIADRQRRYLDLVGDCSPAVDIGCGRGEFLDILTDAGIDVVGVDSDGGMVARCVAKGHRQTRLGDGIDHLDSLEDGSLGLVFAAQVIEHMPPSDLTRFLDVAVRKLRPGGLLVTETVNPHSVAAMKTFWVDITHQHPLFPETMLALVGIAGFSSAYIFHPNGAGDVRTDRYTTGEYAVVARR